MAQGVAGLGRVTRRKAHPFNKQTRKGGPPRQKKTKSKSSRRVMGVPPPTSNSNDCNSRNRHLPVSKAQSQLESSPQRQIPRTPSGSNSHMPTNNRGGNNQRSP